VIVASNRADTHPESDSQLCGGSVFIVAGYILIRKLVAWWTIVRNQACVQERRGRLYLSCLFRVRSRQLVSSDATLTLA